MNFTRTRQLVLMGNDSSRCFVDAPGWLYYYEPFGIDVFVHHRIIPKQPGTGFYMKSLWQVSDISTGLSLSNKQFARTRREAVDFLCDRLSGITLHRYNEVVLYSLAKSPPHKASWTIVSIKGVAMEIQNGY